MEEKRFIEIDRLAALRWGFRQALAIRERQRPGRRRAVIRQFESWDAECAQRTILVIVTRYAALKARRFKNEEPCNLAGFADPGYCSRPWTRPAYRACEAELFAVTRSFQFGWQLAPKYWHGWCRSSSRHYRDRSRFPGLAFIGSFLSRLSAAADD